MTNGDSMVSAPGCGCTRRGFLRAGLGVATVGFSLQGCTSTAGRASDLMTGAGRNPDIAALDARDALNGGADPFPIPWLDRNGSHNQSPGPEMEPSNIFHFNGRIARANDFAGRGTASDGRRLVFGAKSTDFSFMEGQYFAGREVRQGAFTHI